MTRHLEKLLYTQGHGNIPLMETHTVWQQEQPFFFLPQQVSAGDSCPVCPALVIPLALSLNYNNAAPLTDIFRSRANF